MNPSYILVYFVFEEVPEWLNKFETELLRQSADIMMKLDVCSSSY